MTLNVPIYTMKGEAQGTQELNPSVFGVSFNDALVNQVIVAQRASSRPVLAHTKGRGDVRGGGKKPWKQKGTGRASHGSIRSPLWVGGGVTFGPTKERNFEQRINRKMRKLAIRMVLSDKVKSERFIVVTEWGLPEGKTKQLYAALQTLPGKGRKVTLITEAADVPVIRASRNLPRVASLSVGSLNALDLLKNEYVIIPQKLVATIESRYKL